MYLCILYIYGLLLEASVFGIYDRVDGHYFMRCKMSVIVNSYCLFCFVMIKVCDYKHFWLWPLSLLLVTYISVLFVHGMCVCLNCWNTDFGTVLLTNSVA